MTTAPGVHRALLGDPNLLKTHLFDKRPIMPTDSVAQGACLICKTPFDEGLHRDCGGDCLLCMAEAGDTDCALQVLPLLKAQAARYRKLRGWMSSNVPEGWQQVEQLAAIACWVDWQAFEDSLDALPECNVGLMQRASCTPSGAQPVENPPV